MYIKSVMRKFHIMEDCYFFEDGKVPLEERRISVLCVECHDTKMPNTGMFYKGSKEGYGPFNYKCCLCGHLVHESEESEELDENTTNN